MHYFSQFTLMVGAALALQALAAAWLFRTAHAWIGWKLVVPASMVVLACWTPYTAKTIMGLPGRNSHGGVTRGGPAGRILSA